MRQIVLDTETTGISVKDGHRIIEIGCRELINRRLTDSSYHVYLQPDREIEAEAIAVHGISNDFLKDKPRFKEIKQQFLDYIKGAELVIHNATFDVSFINYELELCQHPQQLADYCTVLDSLELARKLHPGKRNSLDALCKRYGVDNSHRVLHGALLDAEILADVYLLLSGGQTSLNLSPAMSAKNATVEHTRQLQRLALKLPVVKAGSEELAMHEEYLHNLRQSAGKCQWDKC